MFKGDNMMDQFFSLTLSVLAGLLAGFCYDYYYVVRSILKLKKTGLATGDLFFWLILTTFVFALLLWGNEGEVRFYMFLGMSAGFFIYRHTFSSGTTRLIRLKLYLLNKLRRLLLQICLALWVVFSFPFRLVYLGVAAPFGFGASVLRRAGRKTLAAGFRPGGRWAARRWREFKTKLGRLVGR